MDGHTEQMNRVNGLKQEKLTHVQELIFTLGIKTQK